MHFRDDTIPERIKNNLPQHVAIIPDGARRWADNNDCSYKTAYEKAVNNMGELAVHLFQLGTQIVSTYFSSTYNFVRPLVQVEAFCSAEANFLLTILPDIAQKFSVRVFIAGNRIGIPDYLVDAISFIESYSAAFSARKMFVCINYNSYEDIKHAITNMHRLNMDNDLDFFKFLWVPYPVNILIRTGNANVLSSFLLLQSACARVYFSEKMFNDFTVDDLQKIINHYQSQNLLYGE